MVNDWGSCECIFPCRPQLTIHPGLGLEYSTAGLCDRLLQKPKSCPFFLRDTFACMLLFKLSDNIGQIVRFFHVIPDLDGIFMIHLICLICVCLLVNVGVAHAEVQFPLVANWRRHHYRTEVVSYFLASHAVVTIHTYPMYHVQSSHVRGNHTYIWSA